MASVIDSNGKVLGDEATPEVFTADPSGKTNTIFRAVHRELASRRAGTASTKKRDEVAGGGRKPWKQKGTGRARQGSIRSPQWRHGGVVFGPLPRSYVSDLNKKERRAALIAALCDRFAKSAVTILDTSDLSLTKTREFAALVYGSAKAAKLGPTTLVVYGPNEHENVAERLHRAGGNLRRVAITHTGALDVKDVLGYTRMLVTRDAFDALKTLGEAK
ncbi:MAG TPA: 50S ribosomal protein L4 [Candidatus Acidoferrales bacterium]|nr:50S ribosomal protein L4 [Candidatus Acidoferrales bacterium]